jgi:hypothetical protein
VSFTNDKEINEYRDLMAPPKVEGFEDGFNWKAVVGAIFLGFIVMPASDYLGLVIGSDAGLGGAMRWILVILFAEMARRSFTSLKCQELYVLQFMVGYAMADQFTGYLWTQYVAQSDYIKGLGLDLPTWAFPAGDQLVKYGRTFLSPPWYPIIALTMFGAIISRVHNYGLGYLLYRLVNDVEKLPFPFAPVDAAGIVALSTDRGNDTKWRWRCFSIGGVLGILWGLIYVCVPMITEAILPRRVEIIPMIFLDFTAQIGKYLPAVPFNLVIDFGAFLGGMMAPFWAVIGGLIALGMTWVLNPILQHTGILSQWRPDMGFIDTSFYNGIDFYISFGIGVTLAVTFSQLVITVAERMKEKLQPKGTRTITHRQSFSQSFKENWKILFTNNVARGDFSVLIAVAIYVIESVSWIALGWYLMKLGGGGYPVAIMTFYALIYTPILSYATAKMEGLIGRGIAVPYIRELTILATGYQGAAIWFAPMPIQNVGGETRGFRVLELTGTKVKSQVKTILLTLPIVVVASFFTAEILWRMAPVPSGAYPYTEKMWEMSLRNAFIMYTATSEGGSQFLEALHGTYVVWGLIAGSSLLGILTVIGLPVMLIFGVIGGLSQVTPGTIFCGLVGAIVGRLYFKKRYKEMWLKYMTVILAGYGCGIGIISMVGMGFSVITRMLSPTLW